MMTALARRRYIETIPDTLLREPLNFIFADHYRQRVVCTLLEELADAATLNAAKAEEVVDFLANDMARHVLDEEEDLFPLLRRRCAPEDEIEAILNQLALEHAADERLGRDLVVALGALIAAGTAPRIRPKVRELMLDFARRQRRHLMVENNIVLPIARTRLLDADLAGLTRRMAARRSGTMAAVPDN